MFSFLSLGIVPSTYLGSQAAVGASFVVLLPALLAALMLMLTGFLMFVLLAYAVVKYAITCADVLIKYLQQTVILFLLIGTGPIFIGMILFERTKPFFDKWKSLCVGSMFQPVLIIAMLVFVDSLVMEWLFALFDFDACLECTINIDLSLGFVPGKLATICIGSTYVPNIPLMHLGEFFAKLIGYSLLVHMASHVVSTAETLSNRLFGTFELQVAGVMR
jgi:type IV secretory pathway VirB6-like protein